MLRSIGAIAAGFVFIALLSVGTGEVLKLLVPTAIDANGRMESVPLLLFSQAYVALFAITGCWLAARLAGRQPMRHALVLGALGLVFNLASASAALAIVPMGYLVVSILLVMPYAWVGGRIRERQVEAAAGDRAAQPQHVGVR